MSEEKKDILEKIEKHLSVIANLLTYKMIDFHYNRHNKRLNIRNCIDQVTAIADLNIDNFKTDKPEERGKRPRFSAFDEALSETYK